ncbi:MAG: DUF3784 domain-containing protein [Oscillospiraceae bacterium]|nr:DUF3784 domain-containing protein [Oscillospiraceae bacterium]
MLYVIHLSFIALFVVLGLVFRSGRGAFLIAGYNAMTPQEKVRYDEKKLCKAMGKFCFVLAALWLPILLASVLDNMVLLAVALVLFCAAVIAGVILFNTGSAAKK